MLGQMELLCYYVLNCIGKFTRYILSSNIYDNCGHLVLEKRIFPKGFRHSVIGLLLGIHVSQLCSKHNLHCFVLHFPAIRGDYLVRT